MSLNAGLYTDDGPPFLVWINADIAKLATYIRQAFAAHLAAPIDALEVARCELGLVHVRCANKRVGYVIISQRCADARRAETR